MLNTFVDTEDVDCVHGLNGFCVQDLTALEELLEKEVKFAQTLADVLFVLEAQISCHLPRRGCFRRRIGVHRNF
eukprot:jgi/Antlo1/2063/244